MAYTAQQIASSNFSQYDSPTAGALTVIANGGNLFDYLGAQGKSTDPAALNALSQQLGLGNLIEPGGYYNSSAMTALRTSPQANQILQSLIQKDLPTLQAKYQAYIANPSAYTPNNNSFMQAYDQYHNASTDAAQASAFGDLSYTQAAPLPGSITGTSSTTSQTGGSPILSGQLSLNSTDTAGVKALQTFLNSQGANLTVDGKFGPLTQTAVKNYQTQNGLQADGIVGPLTMAKINGTSGGQTGTSTGGTPNGSGGANGGAAGSPTVSGNTVTFNGQTYTTSSPEEASFLQNAIVPFLDQLKQQGLAINPDLNLGPEVIAKILTKAQATVHPQFSQQIENVKQDLARNVGRATDSYNSSVAGARQNFQDLLGNTRENYAGSGLAFSGQRGLGETNLANDENRSLASLSSNYGNTLGDYARNAESQLGTAGYNSSGFQLPNSMAYSADLSGNGGFTSSSNVNMGYTPGSYALGSIPQAETAAALALRNQNVQEASNRKSAGISYQDLYA